MLRNALRLACGLALAMPFGVSHANAQTSLSCKRLNGTSISNMSLYGYLADISGFPEYTQSDSDNASAATIAQTSGALTLEPNDSSIIGIAGHLALAPCPVNSAVALPQLTSGAHMFFAAQTGSTETMYPYDSTILSIGGSAGGDFKVLDGPGTETTVYATVSMTISATFDSDITHAIDSTEATARFDNVGVAAILGTNQFGSAIAVTVDEDVVFETDAVGITVRFVTASDVDEVHELSCTTSLGNGMDLLAEENESCNHEADASVSFEVEDWTGASSSPEFDLGYIYIYDEDEVELIERIDVTGGGGGMDE